MLPASVREAARATAGGPRHARPSGPRPGPGRRL